jgi:hypothetical protein
MNLKKSHVYSLSEGSCLSADTMKIWLDEADRLYGSILDISDLIKAVQASD